MYKPYTENKEDEEFSSLTLHLHKDNFVPSLYFFESQKTKCLTCDGYGFFCGAGKPGCEACRGAYFCKDCNGTGYKQKENK